MDAQQQTVRGFGGPFDLEDDGTYHQWRELKLKEYPSQVKDLIIKVSDPNRLTLAEKGALLACCRKVNLAIYEVVGRQRVDKKGLRALGHQLGLHRLDDNLCADNDSITSLRVRDDGRNRGYIPYTNRPLNWHTDGYYNKPGQRIRSLLMHCVEDAVEGGENGFLDHEVAYIAMRDENPSYVRAFMQCDVMTIPANSENGIELRPSQTGPVFFMDPASGHLMMRYTARKRNIIWKRDEMTQRATGFMQDLLSGNSPYILRYRLKPGQGIVCNNVLHKRCAFKDDESRGRRRLIYRARYYDRIASAES